jgi:trans-aconitate methyltransferase
MARAERQRGKEKPCAGKVLLRFPRLFLVAVRS